ncbi:TonB-dependent receptor, partial [Gilvimarinus sp. 1_MG-2023]|uniref:TonB-dependent receptor n=1 Tax=Gilvimarinus sp. 1_MG-2023 TaxID=3062638 RepID=UPI0026E28087
MAAATTMASLSHVASAQQERLEEVVITGIRSSMETSTAIKQQAGEIVESITAEDVGKLPDSNVAETLTRIPGVQGYRYGGEGASPVGEGSGLTVRGLSGQTASRLNGRTYFTAGSREFNIESAIPGMIAGIDVYKNPSAKHIEGAIGGLINIRTRRPLDMDEQVVSLAATAKYNDFTESTSPDLFGLVSNTWYLDDGSEMGLMFAANVQESHNRSDSTPANRGPYLRRAVRADSSEYEGLAGANQSYAGRNDVWYLADPTGNEDSSELMSTLTQSANVFQEDIYREREGYNAAFQWAPSDDFEVYVEGNYNLYNYNQEYQFLVLNDSRTIKDLETIDFDMTESLVDRNVNGGVDEVLAEQVLISGESLDSSFFSLGGESERPYETWLIASGFDWNISDKLNMTADLSYVEASQTQDSRNVQIDPKLGLTWDFARELYPDSRNPSNIQISGPDLSDPNNFVFNSYANVIHQNFDDDGLALQTDFTYDLDGFFHTLLFGARVATQESSYSSYNFTGQPLTDDGLPLASDHSNAVSVAEFPELYNIAPNDWIRNETDFPGGYLTYRSSALHSGVLSELFPLSGIPANGAIPENVTSRRHADERTAAAYLMGEFSTEDERIRGNVGVRVVETDIETRAWVVDSTGGESVVVPVDNSNSYVDVLPSLNVTYEMQEDLLLRFGYSKGMTRPNFGALVPSVTVDLLQGLGSGGNPDLEPLKADSYDISLEKYFGSASYASVALFTKEIDGFINGSQSCETVATAPAYNGTFDNSCPEGQYLLSRDVNAGDGNATGIELAAQTFFDFLPGIWQDFGVAASYTHVETDNPVEINGEVIDTPQAFQSDDSYSISALYEGEKTSARLVYSYRSEFIMTGVVPAPVSGRYIKGYGLLDASINYDLSDRYTISLSASNLTDEAPLRYIGEPGAVTTDLLTQYFVNGRNFSLSFRAN